MSGLDADSQKEREAVLIPIDDDRPSDSPFVKLIWRTHSERGSDFTSIAMSHWEMVVSRLEGETFLSVRGPESKPTPWYCPEEGEWLGIRFNLGTFMPQLPPSALVDGYVTLPNAGETSFRLGGSDWDFPDFENADFFVRRLVREGLLVREPVVTAALRGQLRDVSPRTARRHFVRTTGLTPTTAAQIERARHASALLLQGMSIPDVVYEAGYFDQPHLTRSLKRYIGRTPGQLARGVGLPLSYLYKTA